MKIFKLGGARIAALAVLATLAIWIALATVAAAHVSPRWFFGTLIVIGVVCYGIVQFAADWRYRRLERRRHPQGSGSRSDH